MQTRWIIWITAFAILIGLEGWLYYFTKSDDPTEVSFVVALMMLGAVVGGSGLLIWAIANKAL